MTMRAGNYAVTLWLFNHIDASPAIIDHEVSYVLWNSNAPRHIVNGKPLICMINFVGAFLALQNFRHGSLPFSISNVA